MNKKQLSIIIVSYNAKEYLKACLRSIIAKADGIDYEVIVVDNASDDGSAEMVKTDFPQFTIIENDRNAGFASANNTGIKRSSGEYVLILNSDTMILDRLFPLIDFMGKNRSVGLAGCGIYDADMKLLPPIRHFPNFISELYKLTLFSIKDPVVFIPGTGRRIKEYASVVDVDWVEGCFMLIGRDVIEKAGYMDERYFLYYEDIDLCYSIKKVLKQRVIYYPYVKIQHFRGRSTVFSNALYLNQFFRSCKRYFQKNKGKAYSYLFSLLCLICWTTLFLILGMAGMIYKNEKISRKRDMLKYVIGNNISGKNK